MDFKDLSPDQWREIETKVMAAWRAAYDVAQIAVDHDMQHDDPLYHFAGSMLSATCNMRRLVYAMLEGGTMPTSTQRPASMYTWVSPHTGGGCYPRKGK